MNCNNHRKLPIQLVDHDKILIIQFKYLGDAVFLTPVLVAIHEQYPNAEIHVLVAEEVAPLFEHLNWLKKVWALPRTRGKARLSETWPFIQKLRKEKFKVSIDFAGNDRGSIFSLLIGATDRIAPATESSNLIKKLAYTKIIDTKASLKTWVDRNLYLLTTALKMATPTSTSTVIKSDDSLTAKAQELLGDHDVIFHLGTSQPRKEWPANKWLALYQLAKNAGYKIAFSAGPNHREQSLAEDIRVLEATAFVLPPIQNLSYFLAILNESKLVISGDTGPLHFAAGLGKKVIGLFAVQDGVEHYAPIYAKNEVIIGNPCTCTGELVHFSVCKSPNPCMNSISPEQVFELLKKRYPLKPTLTLK